MRLFVAVELDRGMKKALARARDEALAGLDGLRATADDGFHLTLRFVGEVSDDRITDVIAAAEAAADVASPFTLELRGLGCFPKPGVARVLWAGIEPCEPLARLARSVDAEVRRRGFPPEPKGFVPHITLARARGRPARLTVPLDAAVPRFGEQSVEEIVVMESRLSPRGPTYVPVARVPLADLDDPR